MPSQDRFQRFAWGVPPKKQGDYAYLLHIIRSMKSTGKAACILPHGVLFRGNAEAVIRQQLVRSGYLKAIIGLPANLFYGTGIPACILVLDKANAAARKGIFMIDASKGFMKDGPKNRLREQDIHRIVDTFTRQDESDPRYARMVPVEEIADPKNDYNLNLPRYIDSTEPEDLQDIDGHLRGGIPERDIDDPVRLKPYWKILPSVRAALFEQGDRPGYCQLQLPIAEVKPAIFGHAEFTAFQDSRDASSFASGRKASTPLLKGFAKDGHPKPLIETIAEDLLATFKTAPLLDAYDIYQHLMDYWAETMQDDCYLIAADGWKAGAQPREIRQVKNKENKLVWPEPHDFKKGKRRFKSDLIPAAILIDRYFPAERDAIAAIEAELAAIEQQLDEKREEQSGEEGPARGSHRGRGREAEDYRQGCEGAPQGDRLRTRTTQTNAWPSKSTRLCSTSRRRQGAVEGRAGSPGGKTRRQISHAHRGRNQDARGGRQMAGQHQQPPLRANLTGSRTPSRAASASSPNATLPRCPNSPTKSASSPAAWKNILQRWGRYGSEARLQANRSGRDSAGLECGLYWRFVRCVQSAPPATQPVNTRTHVRSLPLLRPNKRAGLDQ